MSTHNALRELKVSATDISTEIITLVLEKVTFDLEITQALLVRVLKFSRLVCTDASSNES